MSFTLRDAKAGDLEELWRIDQKCFPAGIAYSRSELKYFMRRRGSFTLVAKNDADAEHEIMGFLVAHSGVKGHIITIDVVEAGRRTGVGSQMLQAAEERLRRSGARAVTLETAVDNLAALAFYKRHGYEVVRTIPGYYCNGVDALSLIKQWAVASCQ